LLYLRYMWGRELVENVRIPSNGGRGSKIAQTTVILYLNVPLLKAQRFERQFGHSRPNVEKCVTWIDTEDRCHVVLLISPDMMLNYTKELNSFYQTSILNSCWYEWDNFNTVSYQGTFTNQRNKFSKNLYHFKSCIFYNYIFLIGKCTLNILVFVALCDEQSLLLGNVQISYDA